MFVLVEKKKKAMKWACFVNNAMVEKICLPKKGTRHLSGIVSTLHGHKATRMAVLLFSPCTASSEILAKYNKALKTNSRSVSPS